MESSFQEGRPSPSSAAVQNAAPTEASGPSQQPKRRVSTTASSEYRKHSLEDILHTPDGISTKRVKSSLAVVTVPECNVELQSHGDGSSKSPPARLEYINHIESLHRQSKRRLMEMRKSGEVGGSITGSGIVDGSDVYTTHTHENEIYGSTNANIEKPSNLNVASPARVGAFNISGARIETKIQEKGNLVSTFWEDHSHMSGMLKIGCMQTLEILRGLEKSNSTAEGSVPSTQGMSRGSQRQRDTNREMNSPNTRAQESPTPGNSLLEISSVKDNPRIAYPSQVSTTGINSDMSIFCGAPSLHNLLEVIKQTVPNSLAQLPQCLQEAKALEALLPSDKETIRKNGDDIRNKEHKIKALEQKYDELLQMMPESQHEELLLIKEKSKRTMQQEVDELTKANEDTLNVLQVRKAQIAQFKIVMANLKQVLPEVMQALTELVELAERLA
jgi:hypothetical protein